ncbi:hypothetical protein [Streptacidiphilus cavernicola]|uniref:DUF2637 domain-containing protein n=1 Tax=Streptacidiphilus cavernicola TaxID=3342716 RepID=A0ABV6VXW8_9ACTN
MAEQDSNDRAVKWLVRLSVAAGVVWTAVSEWQLARIIGAPSWVAPALPLAIDAYVIAAVRAGNRKDLAGALGIMSCAQIAARLLDAGQVQVSVALVAFVSILVPLTIWRVHSLADAHPVQVRPEPERNLEPSAAEVPLNLPEPVRNRAPEPPLNQVPNRPPEPPANQVPAPQEPAEPVPPNLTRNQPKRTKPRTTPPTPTANAGTPTVGQQVRQILDLIETHGYDDVKLKFVMARTGMSKTTAYNRLVEARATWAEEHGETD